MPLNIKVFYINNKKAMENNMLRTTALTFVVLFASLLIGCNENQSPMTVIEPQLEPSNNAAIPDNRFSNDYKVLLFGNSHVSELDSLIHLLIETGHPDATIYIYSAGGGYLDDKNSEEFRLELLNGDGWTHLILQGQKYSQSGTTNYSTVAAQTWIARAKKAATTPILFPEHPQKNNSEEGWRVHRLHTKIAGKEASCVAPVGLAWDRAVVLQPKLKLHLEDGNHASLTGKLLTAFVFYEIITGEAAELLPFITNISVDEPTQEILKQIATNTIQANIPCTFEP